MIEQDYSFECPYCGEDLNARVEAGAGRKQDFVQDCEVCCKPIQIHVEFKGNEIVEFSAVPEE